jgi:3-oxoadipate enol-lactonase
MISRNKVRSVSVGTDLWQALLMPFAQLDDVRIHYELAGPDGVPTLVLSNSLGSNLSMWDPQIPALTQHFRVLRYDTRGHGQSSIPRGPYTVDQLGRDVLALLDQLRLDRVHFCGLSMGGSTGMWLGTNAPQRLNKLVLCNTSAKIGTPEIWNPRMDAVRNGGLRAISNGVMSRWLSDSFRAKFPDVAAKTQQMLESTDPQGYLANCAAIRDFDARASVSSIVAPTLVISGTSDVSTPAVDGRYLAEQIRGARYVELDAAHLSNIEQSARFTSEMVSFLLA